MNVLLLLHQPRSLLRPQLLLPPPPQGTKSRLLPRALLPAEASTTPVVVEVLAVMVPEAPRLLARRPLVLSRESVSNSL